MRSKLIEKFLSAFLFILTVWLTGCEDKTSSSTSQSIEQNDLLFSDETAETMKSPESFTFNDTHGNTYTLHLKDKKIGFENIQWPLIIIHLFDTNDQDSLAQIPYLVQLQDKYAGDLFILAVAMNDAKQRVQPIDTFIKDHGINYIIPAKNEQLLGQTFLETLHLSASQTQTLPITILYRDGMLYNFYEGAIPMEMLVYDIDEAGKK